jgi:chromatin assembly factor 1 subunit B
MNAPTPAMSSIPGITASNSGPVGAMPIWTPPLTPAHGQGGTHSASSSVSGIPGIVVGRRESESEREDAPVGARKRDLQAVIEVEEGREGKRRRIAPTPVTIGGAADAVDSALISSTEEDTPTAPTPTQ